MSAAIGIRRTPWSRGSATESSGAIAASASSSDASMHQTMPQTLRRWSSSGNASFTGGIVWKLKKPITFRGADGSHSRYAARSSSASSTAQNVGPPTTVSSGAPGM